MSSPNGLQKILMRPKRPTIHPKVTRFLCHRSFQANSGFHSRRSRTSVPPWRFPLIPG